VAINLVWTLFNLILLGAVLGVAAETRQVRSVPRVTKSQPATLYMPDGRTLSCESEDFSMHGLGLRTDVPLKVNRGDPMRVGLTAERIEYIFPVEVAVVRGNHIGMQLGSLSMQEQQAYVRCTFGSPDAWNDWNRNTEADHPLASFAEVFSFGATGYVRLLESLYNSIIGWWRGAPKAA
jgi:cellulose synthase (UDP-forming)